MNKKLVVAAVLVCGVAGFVLSNTVKAQDNTDNSAMNSDNSAMNSDNTMANAS
jgi:hypothetical protein